MARTIEISLSSEKLNNILPQIQSLEGFVGIRIQKNVSVLPKGDILSVDFINDNVSDLMLLLEKEGILDNDNILIKSTKPVSLTFQPLSEKLTGEGNETSWEEPLTTMNNESNMTINGMLLMFTAGFITAFGINSNTLHLVIGAMVIAPGFEPITRMVLGLVNSNLDWKNGLKDTIKGYLAIIVGAILASVIIIFQNSDILTGTSSYLPSGVLVEYWTTVTPSSLLVSAIASIAGGVVIISNKSVLTAGVMIALALVPAASVLGMAIVDVNLFIAGKALFRLILEIAMVGFFSSAVFWWKKRTKHQRKMKA